MVSKSTRAEREILQEFGKVCAKRPIDLGEVAKQREIIVNLGGKGLLVEASAIIGTFVMATRMADSTGLKVSPTVRRVIFPIINFISKMRLFIKRWYGD